VREHVAPEEFVAKVVKRANREVQVVGVDQNRANVRLNKNRLHVSLLRIP
jgi:hypothetical protein